MSVEESFDTLDSVDEYIETPTTSMPIQSNMQRLSKAKNTISSNMNKKSGNIINCTFFQLRVSVTYNLKYNTNYKE